MQRQTEKRDRGTEREEVEEVSFPQSVVLLPTSPSLFFSLWLLRLALIHTTGFDGKKNDFYCVTLS